MNHNADKTRCVRGHKFTKQNTYIDPAKHQRSCKECRRTRAKSRYAANGERMREQHRAWRNENPETSRLTERRCELRKVFWSIELFTKTLKRQKNKCAICGAKLVVGRGRKASNKAHADHDHDACVPRGVLCATCNWGLGNFKDNIKLLNKAVKYLKKYK